jgi:hypothetical protein
MILRRSMCIFVKSNPMMVMVSPKWEIGLPYLNVVLGFYDGRQGVKHTGAL